MTIRLCVLIVLSALAGACGMSDDVAGYPPGADAGAGLPECFSSSECPLGWTCTEFFTCEPPPGPPPGDGGVEQPPEVEYELSEPASSLRFVYVAMTEQDSLAKIDGVTLAVTSLSVGERPEVVVTAPGTDTAVVLDSINGTATIVRPTASADEKTTFATLPRLNQVVIDPTGSYAVSWFDLNKALESGGGVGQIGSFQDVTILSLVPGQFNAVDLTVGFRPRAVEFDDAGTRAFVITEDGVSVIDLAEATQSGPTIVAPVPVTSDPFVDPDDLEVHVVPTGDYAVVRQSGLAGLRMVRMTGQDAGQAWNIELPSEPSDVDLAPGGGRAYAVLRDSSALAVIDVPGDGFDPEGVDLIDLGGVTVGSLVLSRDGERGLLFTNASLREEITVVELGSDPVTTTTWPLQKSVRSLAFAPGGDKALIVHAKAFGDPAEATSFDEFIDRSYGYSIFDVERGFAKLQITPVDPGAMAFAPDAPLAYVILDGGDAEGAVAQVHIDELDTGVVRAVDLRSPPDAVGVLPSADMAFVSQRHPLGRISFIEIDSGEMRTITGFDLNSRIID